MTNNHPSYSLLILLLSLILPSTLCAQDTDLCAPAHEDGFVHYCNLNDDGDGPGGAALKIAPLPNNNYLLATAQQFTARDVGNVTSVTVGFSRVGAPGGKLVVSIREVDEASGKPGESVGVLGELEIDPTPLVDFCALPTKLESVTVEGMVSGLEPGKDYFLAFEEAEDDAPQLRGGGPCGPGAVWLFELVPHKGEVEPGRVDWPDAEFPPGDWGAWDENLALRVRIEGSAPSNPKPLNLDIDHAVAVSWDSETDKTYQIHRSTDMENWEVAIDNIEGTGERMMQCFIREENEVYYRVESLE